MFFKTIGKMKNDNRGFTLTELVITIVIMALVAGTIALIAGNIWKRYRLVENRFIVQTEVKAIMDAFAADASTGSLSTATNVCLLYEEPDYPETNNKFLSCPELGNFTVNDSTHAITFSRDLTDSEAIYSYLFVYDDHFYVLNGNTNNAYRFSYTDEILVNIEYSVSVDAFAKGDDGKEGSVRLDSGTNSTVHTYLTDGVTVKVEAAEGYDFNYYLNNSFALKNAQGSNQVNISGSQLASAYCSGYDKGVLNGVPNNYKANGVTYNHLTDSANVIKYIATKDFASGDANANSGSTTTGFNCSFSFLMMNSPIGEGVKNTFRSFRDNMLRGNALGELVIEKYYAWSPAVISIFSEHKLLRDVSARLITDTAYLIEMVKA